MRSGIRLPRAPSADASTLAPWPPRRPAHKHPGPLAPAPARTEVLPSAPTPWWRVSATSATSAPPVPTYGSGVDVFRVAQPQGRLTSADPGQAGRAPALPPGVAARPGSAVTGDTLPPPRSARPIRRGCPSHVAETTWMWHPRLMTWYGRGQSYEYPFSRMGRGPGHLPAVPGNFRARATPSLMAHIHTRPARRRHPSGPRWRDDGAAGPGSGCGSARCCRRECPAWR
jgi:hypothetical protein